MDELLEKYKQKGLVVGSELLLTWADAISLIDECVQKGYLILGIDFYKNVQGDIEELVGCSADFSELRFSDNPVLTAAKAAKQLMPNTYPEEADWASFVLLRH